MPTKRLHYFDHQFLRVNDFSDEQAYHLGMRRRLTRLFNTFGIAEGLVVNKTGNRQVTVRLGVAIDRNGRELVLDADTVLDLSDAATFPGGSTVFVTIAYAEAETDPSTAPAAPGNTRTTEDPVVAAQTGAPPTDGSVVRLAQFTLSGTGDVPGPLNGELNGGVRQSVQSKVSQGSIDGVSSPGGNIDFLATQSVVITPNDAANTITFGESHSSRTDNPHSTTATQVGALPVGQYEIGRRHLASIAFTQADASGATRTVVSTFPPRLILAFATCRAFLGGAGGRVYGGPSGGLFEAITGQQRCNGFGMTRLAATDWFMRPVDNENGVCSALFFDSSVAPVQAESLVVTVAPTPTGLTATLARTLVGPAPLANFALAIHLFSMGA